MGSHTKASKRESTSQQTPAVVDRTEEVDRTLVWSAMNVSAVACGQFHTVCITQENSCPPKLFAWGESADYQCGNKPAKTAQEVPPKYSQGANNGKWPVFTDVSCGNRHSVALTSEGTVFVFGCGKQGQLGLGPEPWNLEAKMATQLKSLSHVFISSVTCGSIFTTFITNVGELYCCGFGENIFFGHDLRFSFEPVLIPMKRPLKQTACGQSHILALDDMGDVYSWGSGSFGQLGHGVKGSLNKPRLVLKNKRICQVAAGRYHSIALNDIGVLYSWGCGENGQLGHGSDDQVLIPRIVEPNIGAVVGQVSCGQHHTTALTSIPWNHIDAEVSYLVLFLF
jgi:alpha-tubulin suppressor-like RCC1 family protein